MKIQHQSNPLHRVRTVYDEVHTVYGCSVYDVKSNKVSMSIFEGKVILVVNTASLCGYTPQYLQLEALYQKYKEQGLVILAFPCNQFANEDPLPISEIVSNIRNKYQVTFPIMNKVIVNGEGSDEFFNFLKEKQRGKLGFKGVLWNFEKFLISRRGEVVKRFGSDISPYQFEPHLKVLLSASTEDPNEDPSEARAESSSESSSTPEQGQE